MPSAELRAADRSPMSIIDAMNDPQLFGPWFKGDSWATWRAILKATFALPMTEAEIELFRTVSGGREPPKKRVKELWIIAGRRAGKDAIASMIAGYGSAFVDYTARLATWRGGDSSLFS